MAHPVDMTRTGAVDKNGIFEKKGVHTSTIVDWVDFYENYLAKPRLGAVIR